MVSKDSSGAWTWAKPDGSTFTFDAAGLPTGASPGTATLGAAQFTYSFSTAGHLKTVTDDLGRVVHFNWDGTDTHLQTITTWDNRTWSIDYDNAGAGNKLQVLHDPEGATVTFGYDAVPNLTWIKDGLGHEADVTYSTPSSPAGMQPRVATFQHPGVGNVWSFAYDPNTGQTYTGQIAAETDVTDPRGNDTTTAQDYQTDVQFNTAGLPIKIDGPAGNDGKWPTKTMSWDTNGNLLCSRSPAANAKAAGCSASDPTGGGDHLSTVYTYQDKAPYRELSETGPAPSPDGTGTRPLTTYAYDDGLTGLYWQGWNNASMAGIPASQGVDSSLDQNFGSGTHAGLTAVDNYSLRWTGYLHPTAAHKYHFRVYSDDGVRLSVGTSLLLDCFGSSQNASGYNCQTSQNVTKYLGASDHAVALEYSDLTGVSSVDVQWDQGNGTWADLPASVLTPNLGDLTTKTDPLGQTTYAYTSNASLTRHLPDSETRTGVGGSAVPDPARTTSYTYDVYGRVLTTQTAAGTLTNTFSTTDACLGKTVDAAGAETDYTCDGAGDITQSTVVVPAKDTQAAQNRLTTTTYDGVGRVKTVTTPDSVTIDTYDAAGELTDVEVTDTLATHLLDRLTHNDYGPANRLTDVTLPDPDGTGPLASPHIHYAYDRVGNQTSRTDARGKVWSTIYDAANRVVQTTSPANDQVSTVYNDTGQGAGGTLGVPTATVSDPAGVATVTALDLLGRKTSTRVGSLAPTAYAYDAAGDVTQVTDPTGAWVQDAYNEFGQVVAATAPTGTGGAAATTGYSYDTAGRLGSVTDPNSNTTGYWVDGDGRITRVIPAGQSTSSSWVIDYDAAGERVKVTDPDGRVRDLTYDTMGRLSTSKEYPSGQSTLTTTYHYDAASELTSVDDPRAITLHLVYDNLGRRIQRYGTQGQTTIDSETFGYDAGGNMTSASGAAASIALGYDDASRLSSLTEGAASTSYTYSLGRVTAMTDPAGTSGYGYDAVGRLNTITDPLTHQALTAYTFDDAGRELTRTDPAGLTLSRGYDAAGRPTSETLKNAAQATLASFSQVLDPGGRVTDLTQSLPSPNTDSGTWHFTYTRANELSQATSPGAVVYNYGYDGAGDRTSVQQVPATAVSTTYDGAGRPTSATDGTVYTFDPADQLLSRTGGGSATWSYSYDSWGRTVSASGPGSTPLITYAYDPLDRLLSRNRSGTTITYAYTGQTQDVASSTTGAATTAYASTPGGPLAQSTGGVIKVFEPNLHGDLAVMASTSATVTGTEAYSPWGEKRSVSGDAASALFSFQSDPTDADTGLVDEGARNYDPSQGRFVTRDTLFGSLNSPMSLNQFVYGEDNPVSLTDPDGMCADPTECPPPPGAARSVVNRWHHLQSVGDFYASSSSEQRSAVGGSGLSIRVLLEPAEPPVLSIHQQQQVYMANYLRNLKTSGEQGDNCFMVCGWGRAAGGFTAHFPGDVWHAGRLVLNGPATAAGVGWAMTHGGSCGMTGQLVVVCDHVSRKGMFGQAAFTFGSTVMTKMGRGDFESVSGLMSHETKHTDQYAMFSLVVGPVASGPTFVAAYGGAWGAAGIGGRPECNIFERWAGYADGHYTECLGH